MFKYFNLSVDSMDEVGLYSQIESNLNPLGASALFPSGSNLGVESRNQFQFSQSERDLKHVVEKWGRKDKLASLEDKEHSIWKKILGEVEILKHRLAKLEMK